MHNDTHDYGSHTLFKAEQKRNTHNAPVSNFLYILDNSIQDSKMLTSRKWEKIVTFLNWDSFASQITCIEEIQNKTFSNKKSYHM